MPGSEAGTFLFTDLVGSTALASNLDSAGAEALRQSHFSLLRSGIASADGIEVKNLGDGLMVRFTSPSRALSCAVAMQKAIARYNRHAEQPLSVRMGVATGEATEEGGDYFGEPVIEAARLCAVAQGGQILATDMVRAMARRSGHGFATERELELKGLPDPVVAWEVTWTAPDDEASGIPVPPRLPIDPGIGVVGRHKERALLAEALKAVASGEGQKVVLVGGEAGLGKTTLIASVAREAHREGALVLYGRCDEDLVLPYQPFVEALGHYVAHAEEAVLADLEAERLSTLVRLVPELRRRRPDIVEARASDPDAERWLLYGAVIALLDRASEDTPVVLVLDDLHWADGPSLHLLRHLASHPVGPLLVLGSYRDLELSSAHPLTETLAALTREHQVTRVALSGLDDDEVLAFLEAAAGHEMDDAGVGLAHALYQETDGNPFFVAEVLRHLVETRAIMQDGTGRWMATAELAEVGLPDSVRQVVGSRVARLGAETSRVLSAAAVVGQEFDLDLVARISGLDEEVILDLLEAAASAALTTEVPGGLGRFRFAHALIQHTLYADLGATRRARLHGLAADALEAMCGDDPGERTAELARHWLSATRPTDTSKAVSYARLAGDRAIAALAPAEGIRWYGEALGALAQAPDDKERARCLSGLGEAQRQVGDPAYRETLLEAAHLAMGIGDVDTLVRAALANNRGNMSAAGVVDSERVAVEEAALGALVPADSTARARLLALLALERTWDGDYPARRALADEALAMARRLGDPAAILDVLLRRFYAIWMADTVEELHAESAEAEALAEQVTDSVAKYWAVGFRARFSVQVGDAAEVKRCMEELARLADKVGQPALKWWAAYSQSWATLLAGDPDQAEALATEALQTGNDSGQPDTLAIYATQLFWVRWQQGRLAELADLVAQVVADNPGISSLRGGLAVAYTEGGRDDEARTMLDDERSSEFSVPEDYQLLTYLALWAEVAVHLADRAAAAVLYDRLAPWPWQVVFSGTGVIGAVAHFLGALAAVLGRYEAAEAHFAQALDIDERLGAPFFMARTRLEWGRMLQARRAPGDLDRARELLQGAQDLADAHGFAVVVRRAASALNSW